MAERVQAIPDDYRGITPYLIIKGAAQAIEFYKRAFGAAEIMRIGQPDGKVGHAELRIGDALIMLADEVVAMDHRSPPMLGGTPVSMHMYVEDVDAFVARAVAAGATLTRPVADQFYGDRLGMITDPFGHIWSFATHIEDVSHDEMMRRAASAPPQQAAN